MLCGTPSEKQFQRMSHVCLNTEFLVFIKGRKCSARCQELFGPFCCISKGLTRYISCRLL